MASDIATDIEKISNVSAVNADQQSAPLLNKNLLLFMVAMVLANIGGNMYEPLLPLYLRELKADVTQVGLFFTLQMIIPLILQILGGWISDSLGRLRSIAYGSLAGMLAYVGFIWAPTWQWLLLAAGLNAVTRSLIAPSFGAFIAEQSAEQNRARVYGITETIFLVVAVVGPPLGGWLAGSFGFQVMFICAAGFYTLATLIRVLMARAAARKGEASPEKLSLISLRVNLGMMFGMILAGGLVTWIFITDGVSDVAFSLSFNLMPIYLEEVGGLNYQQIGWVNSVFGVAMMLLSIPAGWLADKKGERLGIALGFFMHFLALMVFIRSQTIWGFGLTFALFGVGGALLSPAYQSLVSKAVPEKIRGTAFGLFRTSLGLISLPAPAIGAQLWERANPQLPFAITAWASLLSIIPVWLKFKNGVNGKESTQLDTNNG